MKTALLAASLILGLAFLAMGCGCASTLTDVLTKAVPVGTFTTFDAHITTNGFGWAQVHATDLKNTGTTITASSLKATINEPVYGVLTYDFTSPTSVSLK